MLYELLTMNDAVTGGRWSGAEFVGLESYSMSPEASAMTYSGLGCCVGHLLQLVCAEVSAVMTILLASRPAAEWTTVNIAKKDMPKAACPV